MTSSRIVWARPLLGISLGLVLWAAPHFGVQAQETQVDFARDVQPLLLERCIGCHGPAQQLGAMRLDQRGSATAGGRVVSGSSAYSLVYQRIMGLGGRPRMPPTGALPDDQIALVKTWIDQGAHWPDSLAGPAMHAAKAPDAAVLRLRDALRAGDRRAFARWAATPGIGALKGPGGDTALMYAALYGDAGAVRTLLDHGADPNAANEAGGTALMWAAADLEKTRLLLDRRANPNAAGPQGITALAVAASRTGNNAVIALLLERGAKPTPRALVQAGTLGNAAGFQAMMARGGDFRGLPSGALMQVMRGGCGPCVEAMAAQSSPQSLALALVANAPFGNTRELTVLLDRVGRADPTVSQRPDLSGRTPLLLAANSDLVPAETVRLLLARGADANFKGPDGETALDLALRNGDTAVVDLLVKAGAKAGGAYPARRVAPEPAASPRAAAARSLPLLQKADGAFLQKTGCPSCHHNSMTEVTLAAARSRRIPFDAAKARKQVGVVAGMLEADRDTNLLGGTITNTAAWILIGLAAEGHAADPATDAAVQAILARQLDDGHWRNWSIDHRPPLQGSDVEVTAASIRALRAYAIPPFADDGRRAVERAATWLRTVTPRHTEEASMRLLGLRWAGVSGSDPAVRSAAQALLAEQRPDGGWAQLATLSSDAYATGQALVALVESGALRPSEPAYRRGAEYLRNSQLADGSWYVRTRSIPFQPFFESGFPHGPDQWISAAATNWAVQALLKAP